MLRCMIRLPDRSVRWDQPRRCPVAAPDRCHAVLAAPCSVLDGQPCTPSFCSVFNDGPCIPEIDYPYGQNLQLTIETVPSQDQAAKYHKPEHDLDSIGELFAALRSCWTPPPADMRAKACRCRCASASSAPAKSSPTRA